MNQTNVMPDGLTSQEQALLESTEMFLERGKDLLAWYRETLAANSWADRFEESKVYRRPASSFGFFDEAQIMGKPTPLMGNFQSMFYDELKARAGQQQASAQWMRDQMRMFILKYFMRISDFREPEGVPSPQAATTPLILKPVSICQKNDPQRIGFGFSQLFYKAASDGRIGRFVEAEKNVIIDLRRIGKEFEWILVYVDIYDFSFAYKPFAGNTPSFDLPLKTGSYLVINKDFITIDENPEDGLATYGFGYSFVRNPRPGILNYGPGEFEVAFETINFHVATDGQVRVNMAFASNRPARIMNVPLDPGVLAQTIAHEIPALRPFAAPLDMIAGASPFKKMVFDPVFTALDLTNLATFGLAAQRLCLSKDELFRQFLLKHFQQHYQTVSGSLQTWRQVPDWLDEAALPDWVRSGVSA